MLAQVELEVIKALAVRVGMIPESTRVVGRVLTRGGQATKPVVWYDAHPESEKPSADDALWSGKILNGRWVP
jgi:hypothetical protein